MPKGLISGLINIAFLTSSIATGVFVVRQSQDIQSRATSDVTSLVLSVNDTDFSLGERFAASVKLDSAGNPVGYVNTVIHYDPQSLEAIDITPGDFFENQLVVDKTIDQVEGQLTFTVEITPGTVPHAGSGNIAYIVFTTKKVGSTTLSFQSPSQVSINRHQPNQLKSFNTLAIDVK